MTGILPTMNAICFWSKQLTDRSHSISITCSAHNIRTLVKTKPQINALMVLAT